MNKIIDYGGGRNEGKTERLMKQEWNRAIEKAALIVDAADIEWGFDIAGKIRELKK